MVDDDSMGPGLQLIGARFLNFLLEKLSREFKLCQMSIFKEIQMAIFRSGAPARFQARVGKDFWRKFGAKRRKFFLNLPTLVFSLPTLDLIAWVGKDPPAGT